MINDLEIWLERLSSLYKSQVRQAASAEGMQVVHIEILQYLAISNHYSNTAQAISEYLGQTKGSISQSLKVLEKDGYIRREACKEDKRVTKLYLASQGEKALSRFPSSVMPNLDESKESIASIKSLLQQWQADNNHKGFGQCQSCQFNRKLEDGGFQCGLTDAALSLSDTKKICREHEFVTK
ncbi:MAG: MarR family winged helix-turn-helix transcriptional regulator [Cellvibrionaceae bacterium]